MTGERFPRLRSERTAARKLPDHRLVHHRAPDVSCRCRVLHLATAARLRRAAASRDRRRRAGWPAVRRCPILPGAPAPRLPELGLAVDNGDDLNALSAAVCQPWAAAPGTLATSSRANSMGRAGGRFRRTADHARRVMDLVCQGREQRGHRVMLTLARSDHVQRVGAPDEPRQVSPGLVRPGLTDCANAGSNMKPMPGSVHAHRLGGLLGLATELRTLGRPVCRRPRPSGCPRPPAVVPPSAHRATSASPKLHPCDWAKRRRRRTRGGSRWSCCPERASSMPPAADRVGERVRAADRGRDVQAPAVFGSSSPRSWPVARCPAG